MILLKNATASHHARIETALELLHPNISLESYRELLEGMYGFYALWEAQIANLIAEPSLVFYSDRWKLPLLHEDLCYLGHTNQTLLNLPVIPSLPAISTPAHALGSMYVIEGSTLGGKLIAKHMNQYLGVTAEKGCAFFSAYGNQAAHYWREFSEMVELHVSASEIDTVIASACATFNAMQYWLCHTERLAA